MPSILLFIIDNNFYVCKIAIIHFKILLYIFLKYKTPDDYNFLSLDDKGRLEVGRRERYSFSPAEISPAGKAIFPGGRTFVIKRTVAIFHDDSFSFASYRSMRASFLYLHCKKW